MSLGRYGFEHLPKITGTHAHYPTMIRAFDGGLEGLFLMGQNPAVGSEHSCRLALVARGLPVGHPTRDALGSVETGAMAAELLLSTINERRLGPLARGLEEGTPGRLFRGAKWSVRVGLALRLARERGGPRTHHVASVLYLLAGLLFRFAWVTAGPPSAHDDRMVAEMARSRRHGD